MPRLILLLAVIAVIYILLKRVQSAPPHKRRAEYIKLGLGVAVIVVIGLTLTGRMHWIDRTRSQGLSRNRGGSGQRLQ